MFCLSAWVNIHQVGMKVVRLSTYSLIYIDVFCKGQRCSNRCSSPRKFILMIMDLKWIAINKTQALNDN